MPPSNTAAATAATPTPSRWSFAAFKSCCSTSAVAKPDAKPLLQEIKDDAANLEAKLTAIETQIKAAGEKYGGELLGAMGTVVNVLQAGDTEIEILINTLNAIDQADPDVAAKVGPAVAAMQVVDSAIKALIVMMSAGTNLVKGAGQTSGAALQGNTTATLADAQAMVPNIVNIITAAKALGAKNADGSPLDPQVIGTQISEALTVAQQKDAKFTPILQASAAALAAGAAAGASVVSGAPQPTPAG